MQGVLKDRAAIITGANQGLGFEIAKRYTAEGASLFICARDETLLAEAQVALLRLTKTGQEVHMMRADVSREEDVTAVVEAAKRRLGKIDVLVNNAGIYGPKGVIEDVDWHDWMRAIEINLYGSVLMCRAVLPHFKERRGGKIVQLSGGGATSPLPRLSAYAVSKAAVVRFIETLAVEARPFNVDVNAIAPGSLNTRMLDEILEAGPEKVGKEFYERSIKQKNSGGASLSQGADLAVFLGSSASDGISGKLIAAVWDPWEAFPEHIEALQGTDIYTLRRIVPKDRGMDWGNDL